MKVIAPPDVAELVCERGGELYVRTDPHRCCSGGVTFLVTAERPEAGRDYRPFEAEGFRLFFDPGHLEPPDELHLDVKGRRKKRVEAYWNGCVYAV